MNKIKKLVIDSSAGGNGDMWMRLVSFYAISAIDPLLKFEIIVPSFLRKLAEYTFGDRLVIINNDTQPEYYFTSLGMKDMLNGIFSGKKYIAPYHRAVILDKQKKETKDYLNILAFNIADWLGVVQVPDWKWIEVYQGYLDIIGLKKLRHISYEEFVAQLKMDYQGIYLKLNQDVPTSPELIIPEDLHKNVLIYPTGTSRQFIPVWWAKKYMPHAYYAFFVKDVDAQEFINNGLKVIHFYKEPGDILVLSQHAKWTISTDSFPSHLLQYATKKVTVTITEVLKSRIISPVFEGKIIDSQVICHPCLHIIKSLNCAAGYKECLNWSNALYTDELIRSVS